MNPNRRVITLIGSTKFKDEFLKLNKKLTRQGYVVVHTPYFSHAEGEELSDKLVNTLYRVGKVRIDNSQCVIVINKNGYIGESTRYEILYALLVGVPVIYQYQEYRTPNISVQRIEKHNVERLQIYSGRQQGSTSMLILLAAMKNAYIVSLTIEEGKHLLRHARAMGEEIPGVLVVDEDRREFIRLTDTLSSKKGKSDIDRSDPIPLADLSSMGPLLIDNSNDREWGPDAIEARTDVIGEVFTLDNIL
jgi:hypothetical protein